MTFRDAATTLALAGLFGTPALARQPAPPAEAALRPAYADAQPVRTCESLASLVLTDTTIEAAALDTSGASPVCRVTAIVTHPPAGDRVTIWVALPGEGWNGRFQGIGGGGFSGGSPKGLQTPAAAGYTAASTDTGHEGGSGSFALDAGGRLNWMLIRDNAYLGIHEMTVTAKAIVSAFYGKPARFSYFNGCSTGGRQGLSEAQRYPADYDGILSGAPAINWPRLHVEQMWGPLLMLEAKHAVPMCRLNAALDAAVAACDGIDGVKDGVVEDPVRCAYDPKALVGTTPSAGCGAFTEADAGIVRKIWQGPRRQDGSFLWYGLPYGAPFTLGATAGDPLEPRPLGIPLDWFRYFLAQDPAWDWRTLTASSYEQLWDQSVEQYDAVIGTDNPDLSAFRDRGGKLLLWHGWSDPLIYAGGTIDYFTRVQARMGVAQTAAFARLFMAPGVGHCAGGAGPAPSGLFDALVRWVEEGRAPETLTAVRRDKAGAVLRTRPLCQYPQVARYKGQGSTDEASSFECGEGF